MSLSGKGTPTSDKKLTLAKATSLNPNAAEFVPFALRSPSGSTSSPDAPKFANSTTTLGKCVLDRSESSVSNNSDDEAHQYWRHQLPDDITPDFNVMGEDDSHGISGLPFSRLSITDVNEASVFPASTGSGFMLKDQQELLSPSRINKTSFVEKTGYPITSFGNDASPTSFHMPTKPWDKPSLNNDQPFANIREGPHYNGNTGNSFFADMMNEQSFFEADVNPLEFLASQFPGFAAESLAEVYYANGGDLNLTIEMLTQLELQVDGGLNQSMNSKALSAPNLSALDFPALSVADNQNNSLKYSGGDVQQNVNPYRSSEKESTLLFRSGSSIPSRGATDFASAVRKMASQDSGIWKYDRTGVADASVGSSRNSPVLASSYNGGQSRGVYGDRLQSRGSTRAAPVWLETGEAVANIYSEMREEARDHARLRNAYFEQARQAYVIGNKALAKELSVKGQLHNMQMKAAHGKAQESIYRLRNPASSEMQGNGRGQERIIDLHGLHVTEAIHVLKRELSVLRNAARSADQRIQVYICVGTGHHTKGSRTPARLPISVQRFLLEEGLDYSEPQPGLLRVVVY
ncbi:polyadenylate-binding protein-interacting protein 7 [Lycium barbarum]|uniref:polyadenylate-binding protein-interacting protein 7 n=1 Tax=Lycium barbarum TaxID=112863 RepID=UPI00293E02DA|nr:polyadenylate-binding protein-interacting protein 7 [Lycium barbarum]XP_060208620.1 polyadenylate-binding protein-interacting protein 7 [Lycium barbarum]XP_060208621.1 polyadenylate-binding protein-interacting protein 7 [Lycium barbarum]XP_060208622.1 polyadenylate-binding protein-interacting protein 7 [Lycium barbarum]XP_060208623.1 polyadenylate-binding protein-interacting protein 7 [Lycium barbarum]